tara:strand:+ start:142 stop:573 length:432 start_codon:yes stop_codon:yes gene_type:complete
MSITQEQVTDTLIRDNTIKTNVQIVANTYLNISFDKLSKKLSLLNSLVNQKLFRYFRKYPDKRVAFFCNHERVENNTHSHIIIKVPPEYNVLNVVLLMQEYWKRLDDRTNTKFELYYDLDVKDEVKSTRYAIKRFNEDNFIVI